ncbi:MAG: glycosyltransferase family 39 protein [Alphaproteobacteria bacterium]|nr:glycosyltransferase family 39 protein [Alphaproteobacteria bacterium]
MAKNSFIWFSGSALVFYFSTIVCLLYGFDVARVNLLVAMVLTLLFKANGIVRDKCLGLWLLGAIFYVLTFFISARVWGVWLFFIFLLAVYALKTDERKESLGNILVFAAAFFNLSFVTNTGIGDVQYDFASCFNYIEYILENDFLFWRENPLLTRPGYSSYHPILHFFLAAGYIKCGMLFGLSKDMAAEAAQVVFCFYMLGYYLLAAKILERLNLGRAAYLAGLSLVIFFPAYNAIAGFFNNDCLLLALQAGVFYFALCYYQDGERKNLGLIFLFATAAALTKLSGVLVLPAAGMMVLMRLLEKRDRKTLKEVLLLGCGVFLGIMIWPLYQHFMLKIPFGFVPPQPHLGLQNYSLFERFNPLKAFVYEDMFYHDFGTNLWETMTKTALFLQWDFSFRGSDISFLLLTMVFLYKLVVLCSAGCFVYLVFKAKDKKMFFFFAVLILSLLLGEVLFVLKHPFMCNQDFRYVALLPLGFAGILAMGTDELKKIAKVVFLLILVFCLCCSVVWWRVSF